MKKTTENKKKKTNEKKWRWRIERKYKKNKEIY